MHIADGFLDAKTAVGAGGLALAGLGLALRQARTHLPPRRVPLMGLAAAFVFAGQMVNFPVAAGTSGHLIGATLAAVLVGPSAAVVVLSAVLIVQCFLFADGGVTALGANAFNLAMVAPLGGFAVFRAVRSLVTGRRGKVLAAGFGGWCSILLASISCAGQLALSGTVRWSVALPALSGVHMLIGLGEGAITALVVAAVSRSRPELLAGEPPAAERWEHFAVLGTVVAAGLALFVAPFACSWPDGLEKVATSLGLASRTAGPLLPSPFTDYRVPGIGSARLATALAGAVGAVVAFGLAWLLSRALVPDRDER